MDVCLSCKAVVRNKTELRPGTKLNSPVLLGIAQSIKQTKAQTFRHLHNKPFFFSGFEIDVIELESSSSQGEGFWSSGIDKAALAA